MNDLNTIILERHGGTYFDYSESQLEAALLQESPTTQCIARRYASLDAFVEDSVEALQEADRPFED